MTIARKKWNGGREVLKGLPGTVILRGNAKPKPEQVSKLVKEARGLQSPPVTRLKMNLF